MQMNNVNQNKSTNLLVILGPTASGKSDLAVELAKWIYDAAKSEKPISGYKGAEIISADSRQVYKGLDIGTGKITVKEMRGIPHHLLDIADPHIRFTALDWKQAAEKAITEIVSRGNLPIICGGTGFYISSLIDDLGFPDVPADTNAQKELELKSAEELFEELKKLDPKRASTIDMKNKRRLARAIVIARTLGKVPPLIANDSGRNGLKENNKYRVLEIGINWQDDVLRERIRTRLIKRLEVPNHNGMNMIQEVETLHAPKPDGADISYERLEELGLEYKYLAEFLQMKIDKPTLIEVLSAKIWQYSRRQKTWWKRDSRIHWHKPNEMNMIELDILDFLCI